MLLGKGSYGEVTIRDGKAVKKFVKWRHLIQEYTALKYLEDCDYIVKTKGVDFENLELYMELYDCSLRGWLGENVTERKRDEEKILYIIRCILMGLVELHDRGLAHGDLKPGNVLVRKSPIKAVLGDCGFVSVSKYAKVERTALTYRDPIIDKDLSHDMYSFGMCLLEMVGEIRLNRPPKSYDELQILIKNKVKDKKYKSILLSLLNGDKAKRPTAREILYSVYKVDPDRWTITYTPSIYGSSAYTSRNSANIKYPRVTGDIPEEHKKYIVCTMKSLGAKYCINRTKKGYGAVWSYIENNRVIYEKYPIHIGVTLMILCSLFGSKKFFGGDDIKELCGGNININMIYIVLRDLLHDKTFVKLLLYPDPHKISA